MRRSSEAYLWDIADSCRAILELMQERSLADYEQYRMLRRAVERELSIVGEAVSRCTRRSEIRANLRNVGYHVGEED